MSAWTDGWDAKSSIDLASWYGRVSGGDKPTSRTTAPLWAFIGLSLVLLNLYAPGRPTMTERVLASCIIVTAAIPWELWLKAKSRTVPFLPLFTAIYAVYYAVPIFLLERYSLSDPTENPIPSRFLEKAFALSLAGLCLLCVGYYGKHAAFLSRLAPKVRMEWKDDSHLRFVGALTGCVGLACYYVTLLFDIPPEYVQLIIYLSELSFLSACILLVLQLVGRLGPLGKIFLWGLLVPSRVLLGLGAGVAGHGLEVGLMIIMAFMSVKRRIPVKTFMAVFVLFLLIYPVRNEIRDRTWYGRAERNPIRNVAMFLSIEKEMLVDEPDRFRESWQPIVSRFAQLLTFAAVVELTPAHVPYWKGETYYPLLFKPVPRFLYPGKPPEVTGQSFGHRYGFLAPNDYLTTHNLPQLVELYVNFGPLGVMVGAFVLGTFYRVLLSLFVHPKMSVGATIAAIYISTNLFLMESALSLVIGGIFWAVVFLGLFHWTVKLGRPSRRSGLNTGEPPATSAP